jgi:hypothetical protein
MSTKCVSANQLQHAAAAVASELVAKRHYGAMTDAHTLAFDPRFAVFEYVFDMMLRRRQVEIVNRCARPSRRVVSSRHDASL